MHSILPLLATIFQGLFMVLLIRAIYLFVCVNKMPDSAERTNMRARARAANKHALVCMVIALALYMLPYL
jgi:hypothetical protein